MDSVKQTNIKLYILKITSKAIFTVYILAYQWLIGSAGGLGVGGYKIEAVGTDVAFVNICTINKSKTTSACCLQALSLAFGLNLQNTTAREVAKISNNLHINVSIQREREREKGLWVVEIHSFILPPAQWRRNGLLNFLLFFFFFLLFNIST